MRNHKTTFLTAASLLFVAGAAFAWQQSERTLKDNDLKKLSKSMAAYFEAKGEDKGLLEAEVEVAEEAAGLARKLSKQKSQDIFSFPLDLGQALWLSNEYDRKKAKKGKVTEVVIKERYYSKKNPLKIQVALPNKYNPKQAWPLIIAIPPVDQTPSEHLGKDWESGEFRDGAILAVPSMPEDVEDWMKTPGTAAILTTLLEATENYAVDFDRVYLAGTADGVQVVLNQASRRSWKFAGVIGRRGDTGTVGPEAFCNLPTYLAGSGSQATAFQERSKELGFENCTLESTTDLTKIWGWIQDNPRNSYPQKIEFMPSDDLSRLNWIEIARGSASTGATLKGSIDAGSNTITIDGSGVPNVTLHLSDAMVDLDRPLRIVANGVSKEVKVARSQKKFLEMAYHSHLDPGQVYVASELVEIPAVAKSDDEKSDEKSAEDSSGADGE